MTLEEWRSNPELAVELKRALNQPLVKHAIEVWRELSPARQLTAIPLQSITGNGESFAANILGYEAAIKTLMAIAEPEPERARTIQEEVIIPTE